MRIVTINTGKCDGSYRRRLELLAAGLAALDPDVVALQEAFVDCDGSADTAAYLARRLGLHASVGRARRKPRSVEGRTVLSDSHALRRTQIATLLTHRWFGSAAQLIVGDLNTDQAHVPNLFADAPEWHVVDAFGAGPRATVPVNAPPGQGRCLDYILSLARPPQRHPRFESARIVLDQPDLAGVYPSDHRGVLVSLSLDTLQTQC